MTTGIFEAMQGIEELLESGNFSDLEIKSGEKIHKVHKVIVCTKSDVIDSFVLRWNFTESPIAQYDMSADADPEIVTELIKYLHSGTYNDEALKTTVGDTEDLKKLICNVKMYIAADFFNVPALKTLAAAKYSAAAPALWDSPEFLASAEMIWENTVPEDTLLRNKVASIAFSHFDTFKDQKKWQELMPEKDSFAWALLEQGHELMEKVHEQNHKLPVRLEHEDDNLFMVDGSNWG